MGVCALFHALAFLGSHWNINFKVWVSTNVVASLEDGDAFFVMPTKHVGAPELVPLERRILVSAWRVHGRVLKVYRYEGANSAKIAWRHVLA